MVTVIQITSEPFAPPKTAGTGFYWTSRNDGIRTLDNRSAVTVGTSVLNQREKCSQNGSNKLVINCGTENVTQHQQQTNGRNFLKNPKKKVSDLIGAFQTLSSTNAQKSSFNLDEHRDEKNNCWLPVKSETLPRRGQCNNSSESQVDVPHAQGNEYRPMSDKCLNASQTDLFRKLNTNHSNGTSEVRFAEAPLNDEMTNKKGRSQEKFNNEGKTWNKNIFSAIVNFDGNNKKENNFTDAKIGVFSHIYN